MSDSSRENLLRAMLQRETRSFIQYAQEAQPWASHSDQEQLATVQSMLSAEKMLLGDITQSLRNERLPLPLPGSFPMQFTTKNFLGLDHLAPLIIAEEERLIRALEADLDSLPEDPVREQVESLLKLKQENLAKLHSLFTEAPEPAVQE